MKNYLLSRQRDLKNALHFLACQDFPNAVEYIEEALNRINDVLKDNIIYEQKQILTKDEIIANYPIIKDKFINAIEEDYKTRAEKEDFYIERGIDINTLSLTKIRIWSFPVLGEDPLEIDIVWIKNEQAEKKNITLIIRLSA